VRWNTRCAIPVSQAFPPAGVPTVPMMAWPDEFGMIKIAYVGLEKTVCVMTAFLLLHHAKFSNIIRQGAIFYMLGSFRKRPL
jgi:hypothetical protein